MSGFLIENSRYRIAVFRKSRIAFGLYETIDGALECDTMWDITNLKCDYITDQEIHGMNCGREQGLKSVAIFSSGFIL